MALCQQCKKSVSFMGGPSRKKCPKCAEEIHNPANKICKNCADKENLCEYCGKPITVIK